MRVVSGGPVDTALRGPEGSPPGVPEGRIELRKPPVLPAAEGAGGLLVNAVPTLGRLASVGTVASTSGSTSGSQVRSLLAAGMFLVATLGFVVVQLDRQRRQRARVVL